MGRKKVSESPELTGTWQQRNPEKVRAIGAAWRRANPEKVKAAKLRYGAKYPDRVRHTNRRTSARFSYGIEWSEYEQRQRHQKYRCLICRRKFDGDGRYDRLHIDHDHKTGKVRGLLCHNCNTGLGVFRDKKISLENAIRYLEEEFAWNP